MNKNYYESYNDYVEAAKNHKCDNKKYHIYDNSMNLELGMICDCGEKFIIKMINIINSEIDENNRLAFDTIEGRQYLCDQLSREY